VQELGLGVVGGEGRSPAELVQMVFDAHDDLRRRAGNMAERAVALHRSGRYLEAIRAYRDLAKHNRWASEQWARSVSLALAAAGDCALKLDRRAVAGRCLAASRMSDSELLGRSPGLLALLGIPHTRQKRTSSTPSRDRRRGGR
jgi:hypothetical protein